MPRAQQFIVGLDIGTSKVACVVVEVRESRPAHVVGYGEAPSRGIRKGVVVNLDSTVEAIRSAVEQAELMAQVSVDSVIVGIAGAHVRSFNSRGVVSVTGKDRAVTREDVTRVLAAARAVSIPPDREVVHVLPQEFVVDGQGGIHTPPAGMVGTKLEANVHIVTASSMAIQNIVTCANRAGIEVRETVLEQLAASEAVLSNDERDLGVALIDVGGGTVDYAIFERGSILHTSSLPVGGGHFSNDLAVGLRTPVEEAERLKLRHGVALSSMVRDDEEIEVPTVGGRRPRSLSRRILAEILQPRAEEVFQLVNEEITRAGYDRVLNAGIVLTGGAALLPGMAEAAERLFEVPVRLGVPQGLAGLVEPAPGPEHATVLGLALYGVNHPVARTPVFPVSVGPIVRWRESVRQFFAELF